MRRQDITEEELRRLYFDEGYSVEAICRHLNASHPTVRLRMAEIGISVRLGRPPLPPKTRKWIIAAFNSGCTVRGIARQCGMAPATVRSVVRSENLLVHRKEARQIRIATALKRLDAGDRVIDIAKDLGVTESCVYEWARDAGWKRVK